MRIDSANIQDLGSINSFLKQLQMVEMDEESLSFSFRKTYVIRENNNIIGFICFLILKSEIELEAIFVDNAFQKKGYGFQLMEQLRKEAKYYKCDSIFLEVRENNKNAIQFYKKNNFNVIFCRKNYYGNEDGLIMRRELR